MVKVVDHDNDETEDESPVFTVKGALQITYPDDHQHTWYLTDNKTITWTVDHGNIQNVKITGSRSGDFLGGADEFILTSSTPAADEQFPWTVTEQAPSILGNSIKFKVEDANAAYDVESISSEATTIKGKIQVIEPETTDVLEIDKPFTLRWRTWGNITSVKIEYSTEGDLGPWNEILPSYANNPDGFTTYDWSPDSAVEITYNLYIQVTDISEPSGVSDISPGPSKVRGWFEFTDGVDTPLEDEVWEVGTQHTITWTKHGNIANVKIEYSHNGVDWTELEASVPNAGSYNWTPNPVTMILSSAGYIRVSDAAPGESSNNAISANFRLVGILDLTYPTGGEEFEVFEDPDPTITWDRTGNIANVRLDFSTNAGTPNFNNVITASTPAAGGSFPWDIGDTPSPNVVVRVADASDPNNVYDTSDLGNRIKIRCLFDITSAGMSPLAGYVWEVGSVETIKWATTGTCPEVVLELSIDSDHLVWEPIVTADGKVANTALGIDWTVLNRISNTCQIRVSDFRDPGAKAESGNFKIRGGLTLITPNGGVDLNVGSSYDITWNTIGSISTVKLQYSIDSGTSYPDSPTLPNNPIATGIVPNVGAVTTFPWTIPDALSTKVKVKVTDENDSTVDGESLLDNTIRGVLSIDAMPAVVRVDDVVPISWDVLQGSVSNIKLEYSVNDGAYQQIPNADNLDATDGSFNWPVDDIISDNVKIRISSADEVNEPAQVAITPQFEVKGRLTLNAIDPILGVDDLYAISWTKNGSIAAADVEYSVNAGGFDFVRDAGDNPANNVDISGAGPYSFTWKVPNQVSNNVVVRVTDSSDPDTYSESAVPFAIAARLVLLTPNGGPAEYYEVGFPCTISWEKHGDMPQDEIDAHYDTNEGLDGYNDFIATYTASDLTASWTTPDAIGNKLRVKISDHDSGTNTISDTSNANFEIRGKLELTCPAYDGEPWLIESTRQVTWQKWGNITSVRLEYSIDGTNYHSLNWDGVEEGQPVIVNTPGTAPYPRSYSYDWDIPDNKSTTCTIKVTNAVDSNVYHISDDTFIIRGGFEWIYPLPGDSVDWEVDSFHTLQWNTRGTIPTVEIKYSTNLGQSWSYLTTEQEPILNNEQKSIQVPDAIADPVWIKIYDPADPDAVDMVQDLKIHGGLTITVPDGTQQWQVNTTKTIQWTMHGSINTVKLEYSRTGGGDDAAYQPPNGDVIYAAVPAAPLAQDWTIPPEAISPNVTIRISDVTDTDVNDESAPFKIKASFVITSPDSGDIGANAWIVDDLHDITWQTFGDVVNVNLFYDKFGGDGPDGQPNTGDEFANQINQAGPYANSGTYPDWEVPDAISNNVKIRVVDSADPDAYNDSDIFHITGSLTITSPGDGDKITVGRITPIVWDRHGSIAEVYLEYFDGIVFQPILHPISGDPELPNEGSFAWDVPDNLTDEAKLRITGVGFPSITHTTDGDFKIMGGFEVTYPRGGEALLVDSSETVTWTWTSNNTPLVKIDYSTQSGAQGTFTNPITASTANDGGHPWTVPPTISATVRVRVADAADADAHDDSDSDFRIRAAFTLIEPNGDPDPEQTNHWVIGEEHRIEWVAVGDLPNVKLEYSRTGNFITDSHTIGTVPNISQYDWTIPDRTAGGASLISNTVKIRISDPNDPEANDPSDNNFRITTGFTVITPNGGTPPLYDDKEKWYVGSDYDITWSCSSDADDNFDGIFDDVPQVLIEFSDDGGASFPQIIAATDNDGTYAWTNVDDWITDEARIMISDFNDSTALDISDTNFKIRAEFTLLTPNGGPTQELTVGEDYEVTWTNTGTVDDVKLDYSIDGGVNYDQPIIASTPNDASHTWKVPNTPSDICRVRVMSATDVDAFDVSDEDFKIVVGVLNLTSPVGGERWVTREEHDITWETLSGSIPLVNVDYSKDGFGPDTHSIAVDYDNSSSPNSFTWTIPDDRSATVQVRVSDVRDVTVNDISGVFTIDYYSITFEIRDLLTNEHLSQLTVDASSDKGDLWQSSEMPNNPGAPLGSPVTVELPYGFWTAVWSKTEYGDKQVSFFCDQDQTIPTVFMETTAIHIWRAYSDFSYDPTTDTLSIESWLERDGFVVSGGIRSDVSIYDPQNPDTPIHVATDTAADNAGFFHSEWTPTTLVAGKVYTVIADITNASGAHFRTPDSFSITEAQKLQDVQDTVNRVLDKPISEVSGELQQTLQDQTDLIEDKMDEQIDAIEDAMDEVQDSVEETLSSFEKRTQAAIKQLQAGADQAVEAGQELEETAKKYSWNASIAPNPVLSGDRVTLQLQGQPEKFPLLTIYSWDNQTIIGNIIMPEVSEGFYEYSFMADSRFAVGKAYTYMITESDTGGLVTGSGIVEEMSITTVAGLAAAAPEAERTAKKILESMKSVESALGADDGVSIALTLKSLDETVEELPELISEEEGAESVVVDAINEVSDKLDALAAAEGYDIEELLEEALGENPTIKAIRNKTDSIQTIVSLLQALFEAKFGGVDSPIVTTALMG
jgi:hypothetical protein